MRKVAILAVVFCLMSSAAFAKTHHKKKHPKPHPTPTTGQLLRPEDLQWLIQ